MLALIAGQDVEPVDGSDGTDGRWRIAERVAADRVISTVDPETRHAHKTVHRRQDGYKAHLAVEPDTGIITDCALTKPAAPTTTKQSSGWDCSPTRKPVTVLADSAYGTREPPRTGRAGHSAVIKPIPLRAPSPADSPSMTSSSTTPPARDLSRRAHSPDHPTREPVRHRLPRLPVAGALHHRKAAGNSPCAHDATSTRPPAGPNPQWQAEYRQHRPMVERTIAWLIRGNRRVRYRGVAKNDHWLHHRAAALNLRRLITLGLDHTGTNWVIA